MSKDRRSPTDRVDALYRELVEHYGAGDDREVRAAAKLMMVALWQFRAHGGREWGQLVDEYVHLIKRDPERFKRMLDANAGKSPDELEA